MTLLYNGVMMTGEPPRDLAIGYVAFLFKKGSILDAICFRGIVLTSHLGKTFERILKACILRWIQFKQMMPTEQVVDQRVVDCVSQLGFFLDRLTVQTAAGALSWCGFFDFQGGFR
mmetsp:Transcript_10310/g.15593  ORF Transcript_10310/g.15593 Transcript_10310/m.15593 type:complete len:116 (+) Transcript_10310:825-1172(+)